MTGLTLYAALVGVGVLTGAVAGLLGVGGGIIIVPFLTLAAGVPQHAAEATSLLVILPTAIVATFFLRRHGLGDVPAALRLGVVGAAGSIAGALIALTLSAHTLRLVFAAFLALVGLRLLRDGMLAPRR